MGKTPGAIRKKTAEMTKNKQYLDWRWDDIRYFLELYRQGSLSGAARKLSVRHSTVARHLARLEEVIGGKLFAKRLNGLELSELGRHVIERALMIERDAAILEAMGRRNNELAGRVIVTCPPMLLRRMIMPRLDQFFDNYAGIELTLISEARQANLNQNEADIALRFVRPNETGLVCRTLQSMSYSVYANRKWRDVPPAKQKLIKFTQIRNLENDESFQRFAEQRHIVMTTNDMEVALDACVGGHGVALLPDQIAEDNPHLERIEVADLVVKQDLFLVMREDVRMIPKVRVVADYLSNVLNRSGRARNASGER